MHFSYDDPHPCAMMLRTSFEKVLNSFETGSERVCGAGSYSGRLGACLMANSGSEGKFIKNSKY